MDKNEFNGIQRKLKLTDRALGGILGLRTGTVKGYKTDKDIPLIVNNFMLFLLSYSRTRGHILIAEREIGKLWTNTNSEISKKSLD